MKIQFMTGFKRNFLISGVSSGIGKEFLELIQAKNDRAIVIVRSKDQAIELGVADFIELDFLKPREIEEKLKVLDLSIDVFVNFAGVLPGKSFSKYDCDALQDIFNVNVISPMLITKAIESKLSPNAVLVYLGSVSAHKGSYDDAYAASKGAIHSLVKSLSLKFAPQVRVLGLAPAMIENTRMTNELVDGRFEHNLKTIPLEKAGNPKDISELIYFLTGSSCSFMTGSLIDINGGQYLR